MKFTTDPSGIAEMVFDFQHSATGTLKVTRHWPGRKEFSRWTFGHLNSKFIEAVPAPSGSDAAGVPLCHRIWSNNSARLSKVQSHSRAGLRRAKRATFGAMASGPSQQNVQLIYTNPLFPTRVLLCFYSCPPPQDALDEGCVSGSVGSCGGKGGKPGVGVGASG